MCYCNPMLCLLIYGAEGETRTPTPLRELDPEPSVSTNSTTSAIYLMAAPFLCSLIVLQVLLTAVELEEQSFLSFVLVLGLYS